MFKRKRSIWVILLFLLGVPIISNATSSFSGTGKTLSSLEEEVRKILEEYFKEKIIRDSRSKIELKEIKFLDSVSFFSLPNLSEVILSPHAYKGGNIFATISFDLGNGEVKSVRVSAKAELIREVLVTTRHLSKHYQIKEGDFEIVLKKVSPFHLKVITDPNEVIGKRTTLSINPGEILLEGMVEVPPLVRKGDQVILLAENSKFKITALAEAKEEGRMGDRIKVVNLTTRREVYGKVIDAKTIIVDF